MRGERAVTLAATKQFAGSSPHARGTQSPPCGCAPRKRFIPACAGNACGISTGQVSPPVHPRMRGERHCCRYRFPVVTGSSPHARGTPSGRGAAPARSGFIPACAGNAFSPDSSRWSYTVHPRMRGEREDLGRIQPMATGSSPHARGTRLITRSRSRVERFIPACAGNARAAPGWGWGHTVHPRMRGERTSNKLLIYRRKSEPSDSTKRSGC